MGNRPFTLLDVGSGNHSPSKTTSLFPGCSYDGIDLDDNYAYAEADKNAMTHFFQMDLTQLELGAIPDNYYDYINLAHIIEHLHNGDKVLLKLAEKLKKGGYMYVEYPGQKSTTLPSMYGTMNFYDDPTHVRIYSVKELRSLFEQNGFDVVSGGMRRSWFYIFTIPLRALSYKMKGGKVPASVYWDLYGFAEYVFVRKK